MAARHAPLIAAFDRQATSAAAWARRLYAVVAAFLNGRMRYPMCMLLHLLLGPCYSKFVYTCTVYVTHATAGRVRRRTLSHIYRVWSVESLTSCTVSLPTALV